MALSIDWVNRIITVPQADLTPLGGARYELDVDAFRLELKDREDDVSDGIVFVDTHEHITEVTLSGTTYARFVRIINGYTVEFEDVGSPYEVTCVGANHNIADVKVVNQVSLIIGNAAGLVVGGGGGGGAPTALEVADAVWDEIRAQHTTPGTFGAVSEWSGGGGGGSITEQDKLDIADRVWDEDRADHTGAGTFGAVGEWAAAVDLASIADAVWDEPRAGHVTAGTYGLVSEWTNLAPSANLVADTVWDEARSGHTTAGSFGAVSEWTGSGASASAVADAVLDAVVSAHQTNGSLGYVIQRILDVIEADYTVTSDSIQIRRRTDQTVLFQKDIVGGNVIDVTIGQAPTNQVAELQTYSITDGPKANDPSNIVVSATTQELGWIRIVMGSNGATLADNPSTAAAFAVTGLRDVDGNVINAVDVDIEDIRLAGIDFEDELPEGVLVGVGFIDNDDPSAATLINGAAVYRDGATHRIEAFWDTFQSGFGRDATINCRRLSTEVSDWVTSGNVRTVYGTALDANGARLAAQAETTTPAYVSQRMVWWIGREAAGAGSEVFRVRPWSIIRRLAGFLRSV